MVRKFSYAKLPALAPLPDLIELQKNSYSWFLKKGLKEVFESVFPIKNFTGNLYLEFVDYKVEPPKHSISECKDRDLTYSGALKAVLRLINRETGEMKEDTVLLCDLPLMTPTGTFIINGAERVVVSQLVRSPGVYYEEEIVKGEGKIYRCKLISNRGAWVEFELDLSNIILAKIEKSRKFPATILLRAIGYSDNLQIVEILGGKKIILEKPTYEDLIYKILDADLTDKNTQEIIASKGRVIDEILAKKIANLRLSKIEVWEGDIAISKTLLEDNTNSQDTAFIELYRKLRPTEPGTIDTAKTWLINSFFDSKRYDLSKVGRYRFNKKLNLPTDVHSIENTVLKKEDFVEMLKYLILFSKGEGRHDDIDHLGSRRVRAVGEQIQNQFRIGLLRLEKIAKEKMMTQDKESMTPQNLVNIRPIIAVLNEFFGTSQLSQFMDQTNPLAELTHKRRLSALGPGGLTRERAGVDVRDVHHSHYGRICPIETPEGPNIGLINSLCCYTKVNEYGFIETLYRKVEKGRATEEIEWLTADEEDRHIVAQANISLSEDGKIMDEKVASRFKEKIILLPPSKVEYMDVSPKQIVSVSAALIPFLEHDDANRALMGSNMQRQAVPLLVTEAPIVQTGIEGDVAEDSGVLVIADEAGTVTNVDASKIVVQTSSGETKTYNLKKFKRSNQCTCINQIPLVSEGEKIKKGQVIADGPSTKNGILSLGRNVLVAYMPWEGFNFEDAILISERLVKEDVYTSIHIEEYEVEARDTKLGTEEITRELPGVQEDVVKDLDERGIIRIGADVKAESILVGKVTPKGETELTPEEKLLRAIFGDKAKETRDTSLRVPHGGRGKVVDIKLFEREKGDELLPGVNQLVRAYVAQKRKIQVGDKIAGRHGNKGVVSKIFPVEDMPHLDDGTPIDVVLNPLGVPSRMNVGQILEAQLGWAAWTLGIEVISPVFDGAREYEIMYLLCIANLIRQGEAKIYHPVGENIFAEIVIDNFTQEKKREVIHNAEKIAKFLQRHTLKLRNPKNKTVFATLRFSNISVDEIIKSWTKCNFFEIGELIKEKDAEYDIKDIRNVLCRPHLKESGKVRLYDGRTGEQFDTPVTVGYSYICKLVHLVDDKIHARSIGPYALITQQPLGGKAQFGGQRLGEMEVWALEAYGAAFTLQELLTVKSDDVVGRVKTYESIIKGENILEPGVPESFKVLIKELQSIGINVNLLSEDETIVKVPEMEEIDEEFSRELEKELV